jgi:hypothetical protein
MVKVTKPFLGAWFLLLGGSNNTTGGRKRLSIDPVPNRGTMAESGCGLRLTHLRIALRRAAGGRPEKVHRTGGSDCGASDS